MKAASVVGKAMGGVACAVWVWPLAGPATEPASGITQAMYDGTLSLPVAGIVTRCVRLEGEFVQPGDVLLELDSALETLEVTRRRQILESRRSGWESLQRLFEQNSLSVRREELDKARSEYEIARTELQLAEEQLRRRRLVAPCAGVVAEVLPQAGEAVQAYQPVVRLVDTRRVRFVANVEPAWGVTLRKGQAVELGLEEAGGPMRVSGTVAFVSPVVDPASGLRRVEVWFENAEQRMAPGVAGRLLPPRTAARQ